MDRPITTEERDWLIAGLKTLENPTPYLRQLDSLRVVDECGCAQPECHTVAFEYSDGPMRHQILVEHHTEDKRDMYIFENGYNHRLAELEII